MTKRILLVGTETFDSGKTTLAAALATRFLELGASVEYFKPISAHNYLERYAHTGQCLKEQKLYSYDAAKLRKVIRSATDVYLMNPIHRLYVPVERRYQNEDVREELGTLALAGLDSVIALERISRPVKDRIDSTFLLSTPAIESGKLMIKKEEVDVLAHDGNRIDVVSLEELQKFESNAIEASLTQSLELLEEQADIVLIESFNDSIWPWEELVEVDHVIAVSHESVELYDSARIRKAAFLRKRSNLPIREVCFDRVSGLVKPIQRVSKDSGTIDAESLIEMLEIVI